MEADRMVNSFIAKKDLDSEMTVVRNEFESGENSPFRVLLKRMVSIAYDWHRYGRDTIGNRSDIENVRIENLQAFYRTYYQPDNAVLLVAGKFDEAKALAMVAKAFAGIPKPKRTLPPFWTVEPTQDWRSHVHRAAQGRHPDRDRGVPRAVGAARGFRRDRDSLHSSWARSPRAGCTRSWWRRASPRRCSAIRCRAWRPVSRSLARS
jgi:hypothetical protein